jgi:hypothetical protein
MANIPWKSLLITLSEITDDQKYSAQTFDDPALGFEALATLLVKLTEALSEALNPSSDGNNVKLLLENSSSDEPQDNSSTRPYPLTPYPKEFGLPRPIQSTSGFFITLQRKPLSFEELKAARDAQRTSLFVTVYRGGASFFSLIAANAGEFSRRFSAFGFTPPAQLEGPFSAFSPKVSVFFGPLNHSCQ